MPIAEIEHNLEVFMVEHYNLECRQQVGRLRGRTPAQALRETPILLLRRMFASVRRSP
jgi:hypothetical protein